MFAETDRFEIHACHGPNRTAFLVWDREGSARPSCVVVCDSKGWVVSIEVPEEKRRQRVATEVLRAIELAKGSGLVLQIGSTAAGRAFFDFYDTEYADESEYVS